MANTILEDKFTVNNVLEIFDNSITRAGLTKMEKSGNIPQAERMSRGNSNYRLWDLNSLPKIGERIGFLKKPNQQKVVTFYTQKGGTGKTPLAFNFARTLALHNIPVLVVGLDSQETITSLLNKSKELEQLPADLDELYDDGLYEIATGEASLDKVILKSNLDKLDYIPENAGLAAFENYINNLTNPLRAMSSMISKINSYKKYDYIIFDCNPSWNRTVNSVLYVSDIVISPLACNSSTLKISRVFFNMLDKFDEDTKAQGERFIIPTLLKGSKLSRQVRTFFETQFSNICSKSALKESVTFDEAQTLYKSVAEYAPKSPIYQDMISIFKEFQLLVEFLDNDEIDETIDESPTLIDKI